MSEYKTKDQETLAKQIDLLSRNMNQIMFSQRERIFGKLATLIEATISDKEQRKAFKDMLSETIYGPSYWNEPRLEFDMFYEALGLECPYDIATSMTLPVVNEYKSANLASKA